MIKARKVNGGIYFIGAIDANTSIKIASMKEKVSDFLKRRRIFAELVWFECQITEKDIADGLSDLDFNIISQEFELEEHHIRMLRDKVVHYVAFELGFRALRDAIKNAIDNFFLQMPV